MLCFGLVKVIYSDVTSYFCSTYSNISEMTDPCGLFS